MSPLNWKSKKKEVRQSMIPMLQSPRSVYCIMGYSLFIRAIIGVRMYPSGNVIRPTTATYSVRDRLEAGRTAEVTGQESLGWSEDYRSTDMDDKEECRFHVRGRSY